MRVRICVESSEGVEVVVFDEVVREHSQVSGIMDILHAAYAVEELLKKFVEGM